MKEQLITELNELILRKLTRDNKREYCLEILKDIELNMEDSEIEQFVARKRGDVISYENKSFLHTMREFQPHEQNIEYTPVDLMSFLEEDLRKLLEKVKRDFNSYTL